MTRPLPELLLAPDPERGLPAVDAASDDAVRRPDRPSDDFANDEVPSMTGYSPAGERLFASRAILPAVAARAGVAERDGMLVFTVATKSGSSFQRTRRLGGGGRVLQPRGQSLEIWWPRQRPMYAPTVLLVEGESDALAALSALAVTPIRQLAGFEIGSLPGTGLPVDRIVEELREMETRVAFTAFDGDDAGRKLTRRLSAALDLAGISTARLAIPDDRDLADLLVAEPPERRGERFAELLLAAETRRKA